MSNKLKIVPLQRVCNLEIAQEKFIPNFCSFSSFFKAVQPLVSEPNATKNLLRDLSKTAKVLKSLQTTLEKPEVKKFLGRFIFYQCSANFTHCKLPFDINLDRGNIFYYRTCYYDVIYSAKFSLSNASRTGDKN